MKATAQIDCHCGTVNHVLIKKPDYFTPSTGTFHCSGCDSRLQFRALKSKTIGRVQVSTKIIAATDTLNMLMMESQEQVNG